MLNDLFIIVNESSTIVGVVGGALHLHLPSILEPLEQIWSVDFIVSTKVAEENGRFWSVSHQ